MATIVPQQDDQAADALTLREGQRLSQPDFHQIYDTYSEDHKFELIDGIVYMAAAQRRPHSRSEPLLSALLVIYEAATLGVEMLHNATTILDGKNEPQPDLQLRILSEFGGQTRVTPDQYIAGPPELVIEVSHSTLNFDLTQKAVIYQQLGVKEYLVVDVEAGRFHWFIWPEGERQIDTDGVLRSVTFPGLWIHSQALFHERISELHATLNAGLKQPEHGEFVAKLQNYVQNK